MRNSLRVPTSRSLRSDDIRTCLNDRSRVRPLCVSVTSWRLGAEDQTNRCHHYLGYQIQECDDQIDKLHERIKERKRLSQTAPLPLSSSASSLRPQHSQSMKAKQMSFHVCSDSDDQGDSHHHSASAPRPTTKLSTTSQSFSSIRGILKSSSSTPISSPEPPRSISQKQQQQKQHGRLRPFSTSSSLNGSVFSASSWLSSSGLDNSISNANSSKSTLKNSVVNRHEDELIKIANHLQYSGVKQLEELLIKSDYPGSNSSALSGFVSLKQLRWLLAEYFDVATSETTLMESCLGMNFNAQAQLDYDEFISVLLDTLIYAIPKASSSKRHQLYDKIRQYLDSGFRPNQSSRANHKSHSQHHHQVLAALCSGNLALEPKIHAQMCKIFKKIDPKRQFLISKRNFYRILDQHLSGDDLDTLASALAQPDRDGGANETKSSSEKDHQDASPNLRFGVFMKLVFGAPALQDTTFLSQQVVHKLVQNDVAIREKVIQLIKKHGGGYEIKIADLCDLLFQLDTSTSSAKTKTPALTMSELLYLFGYLDSGHEGFIELRTLWTFLKDDCWAAENKGQFNMRHLQQYLLRVLNDSEKKKNSASDSDEDEGDTALVQNVNVTGCVLGYIAGHHHHNHKDFGGVVDHQRARATAVTRTRFQEFMQSLMASSSSPKRGRIGHTGGGCDGGTRDDWATSRSSRRSQHDDKNSNTLSPHKKTKTQALTSLRALELVILDICSDLASENGLIQPTRAFRYFSEGEIIDQVSRSRSRSRSRSPTRSASGSQSPTKRNPRSSSPHSMSMTAKSQHREVEAMALDPITPAKLKSVLLEDHALQVSSHIVSQFFLHIGSHSKYFLELLHFAKWVAPLSLEMQLKVRECVKKMIVRSKGGGGQVDLDRFLGQLHRKLFDSPPYSSFNSGDGAEELLLGSGDLRFVSPSLLQTKLNQLGIPLTRLDMETLLRHSGMEEGVEIDCVFFLQRIVELNASLTPTTL